VNGKGSKSRVDDLPRYRQNYERIDWSRKQADTPTKKINRNAARKVR